jgi:hypothetical protein
MPNHCSNDLIIQGKKERLLEFKEFARSKSRKGADSGVGEDPTPPSDYDIEVNNFIPYPEKFKKQDEIAKQVREKAERGEISHEEAWNTKDGYNSGGYEWCISNWGTKWGIYDCYISYEKIKSMMYTFSTAWSPPLPVIQKMSEMYPDLTFTLKYYECGVGYKGMYKCKGGEVVDEMEGKYRGNRGG